MESHKNPSRIATASTLQPQRYAASHQNTNTTYQKSDTPIHASRIKFDLEKSGTDSCEVTTVGAKILCSQRLDGIYFSGKVIGGARVAPSDVEAFRDTFENTVNASTVLSDSAIQVSTEAPTQEMSIQDATLASANKVAWALGENYRKATNGLSIPLPSAAQISLWGDTAMDKTLPGTGTTHQTAGNNRLQRSAYTERGLDDLADPTVVRPEVAPPVWWINPDGQSLLLTKRAYLSTRHTANIDLVPTPKDQSYDKRTPSQSGDRKYATAKHNVFAGSQALTSTQSILPLGPLHMGQTLGPHAKFFGTQVKPFDHFKAKQLDQTKYFNHCLEDPSLQNMKGNLPRALATSDGIISARQLDRDSTLDAFGRAQRRQSSTSLNTEHSHSSVPQAVSPTATQKWPRSTGIWRSANTATLDPTTIGTSVTSPIGGDGIQPGQHRFPVPRAIAPRPASSKGSTPTNRPQSLGTRIPLPPVPLFADSQPDSSTGPTTSLATSPQARSDGRSWPNPNLSRPGKGKAKKQRD